MTKKIIMLALLPLAQPLLAQDRKNSPQHGVTQVRDFKALEAQVQKMQLQELAALKTSNPEEYQKRLKALQKQQQIRAILDKFNQKELTEAEARKQLFPLIKEEVAPQVQALGERIARLKKRLAFLLKAQKDPGLLVQERISGLLGTAVAEPQEPEDSGLFIQH